MDNHSRFNYGRGHGTGWQSRVAGTTPPESGRVAALWRDLPESCLGCEGVVEFFGALESCLLAEREDGPANEGDSGTTAQADAGADGEPDQTAGRRRSTGGVCQGPLGGVPGRGFDRKAFWGALPTGRRPAVIAATIGVELAAGMTGCRSSPPARSPLSVVGSGCISAANGRTSMGSASSSSSACCCVASTASSSCCGAAPRIHGNEAVRLYLRCCRRLHLHHFPAYVREFNPDAHV